MTQHSPPGRRADPDAPSSRFTTLVLAYITHLVAWSAFCSLETISMNEHLGAWSGYALGTFATVAAVAAFMIARHEPLLLRIALGLVITATYVMSGLAEVAYLFVPASEDSWVWIVGEPFPYATTLVAPFILAGVMLHAIRATAAPIRAEPRPTSDRRAAAVLLATTTLLPLGIVLTILVPTVFDQITVGFPLLAFAALCALVGSTSALYVMRSFAGRSAEDTATVLAYISAYFSLVCGMHLCMLSAALHFDEAGANIGGPMVLFCALIGYMASATCLGIVGLRPQAPAVTTAPSLGGR